MKYSKKINMVRISKFIPYLSFKMLSVRERQGPFRFSNISHFKIKTMPPNVSNLGGNIEISRVPTIPNFNFLTLIFRQMGHNFKIRFIQTIATSLQKLLI